MFKLVCQLDSGSFFTGMTRAEGSPLEPGVYLYPKNTVDIPAPVYVAGKKAKYVGGGVVWEYVDIPVTTPHHPGEGEITFAHIGTGGISHALANHSAAGFMSSGDKANHDAMMAKYIADQQMGGNPDAVFGQIGHHKSSKGLIDNWGSTTFSPPNGITFVTTHYFSTAFPSSILSDPAVKDITAFAPLYYGGGYSGASIITITNSYFQLNWPMRYQNDYQTGGPVYPVVYSGPCTVQWRCKGW